FWDDTVHAGGSEEDWTVHGLWPDLCDGSYKAFCGMTPHFNNITDILRHYGQSDLLASMERYWVAAYGTNNHLWAHEYNKHASCINTLSTRCYGESYDAGVEVVDYFTRAFALFKQLDTFTALERAGIVPSREKTYPIKDVTKTLERLSGGKVVLRCSGRKRDVLHEAWYSYFLKGSLQTGQFVPASELGEHGDANNCADSVRYVPKRCKGNCPPSSYEDL
ncbi:ribonuclease t2, partial [Colletotrichum chrysophilum]